MSEADPQGAGSVPDMQKQLAALDVSCPELQMLETELARFNIFRVLRSTHSELRHSNMLAWLLDPKESHGLGDRFLRRWLMALVNEPGVACALSPVDVDAAEIRFVRVQREWSHIDVLVQVQLHNNRSWVIAIENKIGATQAAGQLWRYRNLLERVFAESERVFVFLTMSGERPADKHWLGSTYELVAEVLGQLLAGSRGRIGAEPLMLLEHYLRLIKGGSMGDENLAELARKIYQTHQVALDFIFEQRIEPLSETAALVCELQSRMAATRAEIVTRVCGGPFLRFLPKAWDVERNRAGTAWGAQGSAFLLCELTLATKVPTLQIVEGAAPPEWRAKLFETIRRNRHLLQVNRATMPDKWMRAFSRKLPPRAPDDEIDEAANKLWTSCEVVIESDEFKRAVALFTPLLDELPGHGAPG